MIECYARNDITVDCVLFEPIFQFLTSFEST